MEHAIPLEPDDGREDFDELAIDMDQATTHRREGLRRYFRITGRGDGSRTYEDSDDQVTWHVVTSPPGWALQMYVGGKRDLPPITSPTEFRMLRDRMRQHRDDERAAHARLEAALPEAREAPAVTWTKTPPEECGYYWMRYKDNHPQVVSGYGSNCWVGEGWTYTALGSKLAAEGNEWWPVPITFQPPDEPRYVVTEKGRDYLNAERSATARGEEILRAAAAAGQCARNSWALNRLTELLAGDLNSVNWRAQVVAMRTVVRSTGRIV